MRCYMKPSSGSIIKFSSSNEDSNDAGDCGGIPVFSFWNISASEKMAEEIVEMFKREVMLKRLLIMELISSEVTQHVKLSWSDELYQGEFDDLGISSVSHTNQPANHRKSAYLLENMGCRGGEH